MGFKNDFSQADNGNIKPEGDYECIITAVEEKTNKNGRDDFSLAVRTAFPAIRPD